MCLNLGFTSGISGPLALPSAHSFFCVPGLSAAGPATLRPRAHTRPDLIPMYGAPGRDGGSGRGQRGYLGRTSCFEVDGNVRGQCIKALVVPVSGCSFEVLPRTHASNPETSDMEEVAGLVNRMVLSRVLGGRGGGLCLGCGDRGVWTAKTVKQPRQQPAHPQYANYWVPLTRKRHTMPHPAQPEHTNYWAPRTQKRHQQEHRPQRPTESSDPTQHAKGRTGDRPGPRKGATTRRNVTQGAVLGMRGWLALPPSTIWCGPVSLPSPSFVLPGRCLVAKQPHPQPLGVGGVTHT